MKILILSLFCLTSFADPFWIEKSSYTQVDKFYAVGVSTSGDLETRRQKSFENAIKEMEFSFGGKPYRIHTLRLYETDNKTYRLISADIVDIKREINKITIKPETISDLKREKRVYFHVLPGVQ